MATLPLPYMLNTCLTGFQLQPILNIYRSQYLEIRTFRYRFAHSLLLCSISSLPSLKICTSKTEYSLYQKNPMIKGDYVMKEHLENTLCMGECANLYLNVLISKYWLL